ncbi:hypothetical protein AMTRI_Chr06g194050 [Amborella trichopoda]
MESNRKPRGFIKGKLVMSLHRASKPTSPVQNSNKVNPSPPTTSVQFVIDKKSTIPQIAQKKTIDAKANEVGRFNSFESNTIVSGGGNGEESVDKRAEVYISYVQERFRLERVESDRRKFQDMHARNLF